MKMEDLVTEGGDWDWLKFGHETTNAEGRTRHLNMDCFEEWSILNILCTL
ncbi:hypothetical protein Syun_025039 [Stephania yunnanensis]|uniref:Uncharacterized protein n=1 Tax=Stephania yunnanensis TaxID=152371 RepID=A0AAP0HUG5_9MAGN